MKHDLNPLLDEAENRYRLAHISTDPVARSSACVPTGLLSLDTLLGGGIFPGLWYTVYGGEGSSKSTLLSTAMSSLAYHGCSGALFDFEGSSSPVYIANMLDAMHRVRGGKQLTASQIFGLRDPKTNKWKSPPIFRLYSEGIGDTMFNALASLARKLPDKVYVDGKWYYVFEEKPDEKVDQKLSTRGQYYVQADNGYPELVFMADSYPMMYPENLDDDAANSGMAAVARMFSSNIPKIMGRLRRKAVTVLGVNQLRLRPGVSYGNPEYEPAGEAVKFASSVRIRSAHLSVPHGKGRVEEEPSVLLDGMDQYKYIKLQLTKNKSNTSVGLETWQRVWSADPEGTAFGFDPVWNVYDYLTLTGQAERFGSGKKRPINLQLWSLSGEEEVYSHELDFMDLKSLILLPEEQRVEHAKRLKMDKKAYMTYFSGTNLYKYLAKQVHNGTGLQFAYNMLSGGGKEEEE